MLLSFRFLHDVDDGPKADGGRYNADVLLLQMILDLHPAVDDLAAKETFVGIFAVEEVDVLR